MNFHFAIDVLPEEDGKGYFVIVPALPGCFSQGKTIEEALKNSKEAISLHINALKKEGLPIPKKNKTFHISGIPSRKNARLYPSIPEKSSVPAS